MSDKPNQNTESRQHETAGTEEAPGMATETTESEAAGEGEAQQPTYDQLLLTLQDAQAKADEHWNQLLRLNAELDNARKRAERDVQNAHKFALEKFVNELLPVRDSLEMGEAAAISEGADIEKITEGVTLTLKMMTSVMEKFGVKVVDPQGERFNPDVHQAMSMQDVPDAAPNTVVNVFQKGYLLNDRLIRPAMVVVASQNSGNNGSGGSPSGEKVDEMA